MSSIEAPKRPSVVDEAIQSDKDILCMQVKNKEVVGEKSISYIGINRNNEVKVGFKYSPSFKYQL